MLLRLLRVLVSGIVLCFAVPTFAQNAFCDPDNLLECTQLSAQKLASEFPRTFVLKNGQLEIHHQNESTNLLLLTEESLELYPDEQLAYPIQFWADRNWLLIKQFSNAGETQIVAIIDLNHDFQKIELNGTPIFSPDHKHLLAYGADIYAGFSANGIAVYQIDAQGKLTEQIKFDESWGVVDARWNSDQEIALLTIEQCEDASAKRNENGECVSDKKLTLINNQWQLSH